MGHMRIIICGLAISGVIWMGLSIFGWGILWWIVFIAAVGEGYRALT